MAAFLPARSEVTEDYWGYARWRAGHRLFSSMLQNFATQACPSRLRGVSALCVMSIWLLCPTTFSCLKRVLAAGLLQTLNPDPSVAKQGPLQRSRCCWRWAWARSARCRPPRQSTGS